MFKRILDGFTHLFKDLPTLPKKLNQARRLCTVEMIINLSSYSFLFTAAKGVHDNDYVMYLAIIKGVVFLSDICLHIAQKASYYRNSLVLSVVTFFGYCILVGLVSSRMYTLLLICTTIQSFYTRIGETSSVEYICHNGRIKYIFWVLIESILLCLKGVLLYFLIHSMVIIKRNQFLKNRRKEWKEGEEKDEKSQEKED
jgi:hypothetical protein